MKQSTSSSLFYFVAFVHAAGIFGPQDATFASALLVPNNYIGPSSGHYISPATLLPMQSSLFIGSSSTTSTESSSSSSALQMASSAAIPLCSMVRNSTGNAFQEPIVPTTTGNMELIDQLKHDSNVIFSIFDVDGSGTICRKEFSNHLLKVGYSDSFVTRLFKEMDTNGDGVISPEEFRTLYLAVPSLRTLPGLGQDLSQNDLDQNDDDGTKNKNGQSNIVNHDQLLAEANQVFEAADKDGNGSIDAAELKSHLSRWRSDRKTSPFHYTAVAKIFGLLDANGDQSISKQEFQDAFVRYSALRHALE